MPARGLGHFQHAFGVNVCAGHRLFAINVFARLQSGHRHRHVIIIVQTDVDRVDIVTRQELAEVRVTIRNAKMLRYALNFCFVDIDHTYNVRSGNLLVTVQVKLTNLTSADHAHTDRI
jgi:hypothetical protein